MLIYRALDSGLQRRDFKLPAPLLSAAAARMINNQAPHHPAGIAHKPLTIGEGGLIIPGHLDVRLV